MNFNIYSSNCTDAESHTCEWIRCKINGDIPFLSFICDNFTDETCDDRVHQPASCPFSRTIFICNERHDNTGLSVAGIILFYVLSMRTQVGASPPTNECTLK